MRSVDVHIFVPNSRVHSDGNSESIWIKGKIFGLYSNLAVIFDWKVQFLCLRKNLVLLKVNRTSDMLFVGQMFQVHEYRCATTQMINSVQSISCLDRLFNNLNVTGSPVAVQTRICEARFVLSTFWGLLPGCGVWLWNCIINDDIIVTI